MMEIDKKILLEKFLDGECAAGEQQTVKTLLNTSEGRAIMNRLIEERDGEADKIFSFSESKYGLTAKVQDWKSNVHRRIAADDAKFSKSKRLKLFRYAAVWAGLLLISSLTVWQFAKRPGANAIVYIKRMNAKGFPVKYVLPDSSAVYLAAGSTLSYPKDFIQSTRKINLQGEAFFDVTHDPAHPFVVNSDDVQTVVYGTSFKVTAFRDESIEVAVATGQVGVIVHNKTQSRQLGKLTPGMLVGYDPKTGDAYAGKVDVFNLNQWKSGELVFDEKPLHLVASELQRRYGVNVICHDQQTAEYKVTGTFPASEPVTKVLKVLSVLGQFKYTTNDNITFHLYKTGNNM